MARLVWITVLAVVVLGIVATGIIYFNPGLVAGDVEIYQPAAARDAFDPEAAWNELLETLEEGPPAYTAAQAEAWVDELIPLVESMTSRRFRLRPRVELVDRAELTDVLWSTQFDDVLELLDPADREALGEMVRAESEIQVVGMLGMYDPDSAVVYLCPTNVEPIMQMADDTIVDLDPVVRLVIAHELTHALQHQHVAIMDDMEMVASADMSEAISATIEGHATFVEERVGHLLGASESVLELAGLISAGAPVSRREAFWKLRELTQLVYERRYLGGRDFMRYHHDASGDEGLWRILANPPTSMSEILDPTTYGRQVTLRDYSGVLVGLEDRLAMGIVQTTDPLPMQGLLSNYDSMPSDVLLDTEPFMQHAEARTVMFGPSTMAEMTFIATSNADFAGRLARIGERRALDRLARRQRSDVVRVRDERQGVLSGIDADYAQMVSYAVQVPRGEPNPTSYAVVQRGGLVFEILTHHHELDDQVMIDVAGEVFRRARTAPEAAP